MISSRALQYEYADGPLLRFSDVELAQGGVLLLRGGSGAGKSTWLALAAGLRRATAGDITVAGQALGQLSPADRDAWRARTIGFLPQKLHLSNALTVAGNLGLAYFAAGLREDAGAIAAALASLGVADLTKRKPWQLSGGQAQRVALARAVLLAPKVILADEPTASLDDDNARDAVALLQATANRCGASLVIATHDARVLAALPQARLLPLPRGAGSRPGSIDGPVP
ncbi:ABC transporter ATP-binding protein [Rhodoferax sp.]|uniref:ABC transporter ATP-binding protein n=1 Tax=Rhodoferax sp. TaxID=50421 RepID=UPI00276027CB|nr:ATP-binding cassette domain-containing protein [Rhodoferax sp.]